MVELISYGGKFFSFTPKLYTHCGLLLQWRTVIVGTRGISVLMTKIMNKRGPRYVHLRKFAPKSSPP